MMRASASFSGDGGALARAPLLRARVLGPLSLSVPPLGLGIWGS